MLNLLDTPGHRDFSEDTYRVLAAADAAVMVLDAAKGIEPQTLKLFEVCRERNLPLLTFINKWDRPGRDPLELLDEIEAQLSIVPDPGHLAGRASPATSAAWSTAAPATSSASPAPPAGATEAAEEVRAAEEAAAEEGDAWTRGRRRARAARRGRRPRRPGALPQGRGDAGVLRLGAHQLRRAPAARRGGRPGAVARRPATTSTGLPRPLDAPFSAFVFKVQANMDPSHRDRIAFVRVCSGRFERGMVVTHGPTGKPFATKYAHSVFGQERDTIEEAWPGDVIGLVNATDVPVGDTLYLDAPVEFPRLPEFAPEHFVVARVQDTGRFKQFRRGIAQLDEEGVVQVLRDQDLGDQAPMLAAVGPDAVRGGRPPARARVRRAGRAEPHDLARRPPHRRGVHARAARRCTAWPSTPAPTAPATRCSSRPTGWRGSRATTPSSSSSGSSPRARSARPTPLRSQTVPSSGTTSSTR